MRQARLTKDERGIEQALLRGEYRDVKVSVFEDIARAIARRRKDAVISIRVNSQDLRQIKAKARRFGVRYQTLVSEVLHRVAA